MENEGRLDKGFYDILKEGKNEECPSCLIKDKLIGFTKELLHTVLVAASLEEISQTVYRYMKDNYGECTVGFAIHSSEKERLHNCFYYENEELLKFEDITYSELKKSKLLRAVLKRESFYTDEFSDTGDGSIIGMVPNTGYFAPLIMNDMVIGGFTYQIYDRDEFTYEEVRIIEEAIPFFTIALNNFIQKEELIKANRRLKELSERDEVTGLLNRRTFYDIFQNELIKDGDRGESYILLMDLDDFKGVNDTYGHLFGDRTLRRVAEILTAHFPENFVGRFGGDEFIGGLIRVSREEVKRVAESIIKIVEEERVPAGDIYGYMGISLGIVQVDSSLPLRDFFEVADKNLYKAKAREKNSYHGLS